MRPVGRSSYNIIGITQNHPCGFVLSLPPTRPGNNTLSALARFAATVLRNSYFSGIKQNPTAALCSPRRISVLPVLARTVTGANLRKS